MVARQHEPVCFAVCQAGPDREAVPQPLGQGHYVRLDAGMLKTEPLAGTTHARLHFVDHQQPVVLVGNGTQGLQVFRRGDTDATLPLDRLDKHRNDVRVLGRRCTGRLYVVVGHPDKARHQGKEALVNGRVSGCGQGCHRPAVEAVFHHQYLRCADLLVAGVQPSQFQRGLVGLGPRVAEEHALHARALAEQFAQALLPDDPVHVRGVEKLAGLHSDRFGYLRVRMPQIGNGNTRDCIQILNAVLVPQVGAATVRKCDRLPRISRHQL
ncbi:hypothetical protein D3C78_884470 [compost metagenome]